MSIKPPLPVRHAFDTQPQAQSSLKENCQLDKGSHNIPSPPLELSTQSHLQPILGWVSGWAACRTLPLTLSAPNFYRQVWLDGGVCLLPQPLTEPYQRMNLTVNLATYRVCLCKSNHIKFIY